MRASWRAAAVAAFTLVAAGPASAGAQHPSEAGPSSDARWSSESQKSAVSDKNDKPKPMSCIAFWGEARYVVGYNHIVHIYNGCAYDAVCSVRTDVNPTPQTVAAPQKQETQVVTFLGSPVGRFVPFVDCVATR